MDKRVPIILALLAILTLAGHGVARAEKGGNRAQPAAVPSVNLGLGVPEAVVTNVGLPAGALNAPGRTNSASLAGLVPPGKIKEPNPIASKEKSAETAEKLASSAKASNRAASDPEANLSQLPTCR
jgi:hypothetical protein